MRQRLSQERRRSEILKHAAALFHKNGFAATEMEDIRLTCGISRGGLYHHFGNKNAILAAIVQGETTALCNVLQKSEGNPIEALLKAGSTHLGRGAGIVDTLRSHDERLAYLGYLDQAHGAIIGPMLERALPKVLRPDVQPGHAAELFLTVNARINRREILGEWDRPESAAFAAMALETLAPLMAQQEGLRDLARQIREGGRDR